MLRICSPRTTRRTGTLAVSLLLASMALPAHAISVDNMVVWSASNKPLRMDVELVDLQGVDLRDIKINVASEAEHARMGLTRPAWADSVRFKVIALDAGKVIARVSASEAVAGDFVSFLISIRGSGLAQLQQVASRITANGGEPLASPQAQPVAPRAVKKEPAPAVAQDFADKPMPKPAPVTVKPAAAAKPVAVVAAPPAAPAPAPAPAPVATAPAPAASPAPAEMVAAAEADNAEVLADVGAEPTLESLQAERIQLLQQVTDLQTRLTEVDQQIAALSPEAMPASETPTALAEAETSPAEPVESVSPKRLGYDYFSNVLLTLLGLFLAGMATLDRLRARKR